MLTDIDYKQLKKWYHGADGGGNIKIISVLGSRYGYLPDYITDTVIRLYFDKKREKQVIREKRASGTATIQDEIRYRNKKTMLARMYGVFVQDPIRAIYEWDTDKHTVKAPRYSTPDTAQYGEVLYQWGVWVAAWARDKLLNMCAQIGTQINDAGRRQWDCTLLYCDTDCLRWIQTDDGGRKIDIIRADNAETRRRIQQILTPERRQRMLFDYGIDFPADTLDGCGEWEIETFTAYKQIGLKQYAYIDAAGHFSTVVAGLPRADYQSDGSNKGMNYFDQFRTDAEKFEAFSSSMRIPAEFTKILRTSYFDDMREIDIKDYTGTVRHVVADCGVLLVPMDYAARADDDAPAIDIDAAFYQLAKCGINVDISAYQSIMQ